MLRTSKLLEKGFGLLVLRSSTTSTTSTIPRHHNHKNKQTLSEAGIHLQEDPNHPVGTPFDSHHPPETGLLLHKADSNKKKEMKEKKKKKKREEDADDDDGGIGITTAATGSNMKGQPIPPPPAAAAAAAKDNTYNGIKEAARKTGDPVAEWMADTEKKGGSAVYKSAKGSQDEILEARKRYAIKDKGEGRGDKQQQRELEEDNKEKSSSDVVFDAMDSAGEKITKVVDKVTGAVKSVLLRNEEDGGGGGGKGGGGYIYIYGGTYDI